MIEGLPPGGAGLIEGLPPEGAEIMGLPGSGAGLIKGLPPSGAGENDPIKKALEKLRKQIIPL